MGHDLKATSAWERGKRGGSVPCSARGRQARGLPFLPAVCEVTGSGPLSCFPMPDRRRPPLMALGTGVGGVDLCPEGWAAPKGDC